MSDSSGIPAAWYPDPLGTPAQRWWDGTGWTAHTRADVVRAAPAAPVPDAVVASPPVPPVIEERRAAPVVEVPRSAPVVTEAPRSTPGVTAATRSSPAATEAPTMRHTPPVAPFQEPSVVEPPPVAAREPAPPRPSDVEVHRGPLLPNRRSTFVPAEVVEPAPWIAVVPATAEHNATATWAFVFGLLAVVTAALAAAHPGALVFSVLALITGILGLVRSRRVHRGAKRSIWALALAVVAAAAVVVVWFWFPDADLASVTWLRL